MSRLHCTPKNPQQAKLSASLPCIVAYSRSCFLTPPINQSIIVKTTYQVLPVNKNIGGNYNEKKNIVFSSREKRSRKRVDVKRSRLQNLHLGVQVKGERKREKERMCVLSGPMKVRPSTESVRMRLGMNEGDSGSFLPSGTEPFIQYKFMYSH